MSVFSHAYALKLDCIEAMAHAALTGQPVAPEIANLISAMDYAANRDTPARTWWDCAPTHPAIARALKIDRQQTGGVYALAPFRLWNDGTRHLILAAYPCPRILGPIDMDCTGIETVLAWNPVTDEAFALGDEMPGLFGNIEGGTVYRSPRDFFQGWAIERAKFFVTWGTAQGRTFQHVSDTDACPGAIAIGPLDKILWQQLPREFEARGIDPTELNRAIIRQANLPRAYTGQRRAAA